MKVAVDARLDDGDPGGVQQTILGLASGLATLDDADDEYLFLVWEDHAWLAPALTGRCRPLVVRRREQARVVKAVGQRSTAGGKVLGHLSESRGRVLPASDGNAERAGAQLIHFMRQRGFRTRLPNIYQPHDLQHVHHPEFFDLPTRVYRQLGYRAMARQASRVSVMTSHGVEDVVRHLGVPQDRVMVVPWASLLGLYGSGQAEAPEAPAGLGVPGRYLLFPAQTWPHKNHLRLLAALARLRDRGVEVPVVLTGRRNQHWERIEEEIGRLRLQDLVVPLDFVSVATLQRLYQEAVGVVFPTLFEGWGLPVVEAMDVGTPVTCSAISPLREIAAGAALLFDPTDVADIATAVEQLWTDDVTRARLREASLKRRQDFSWNATARLFRAHYRSVLQLPPTAEDEALLAAPSVV